MQDTLPIHFAPLQGYTEAIYRNAHDAFFGGVDTYYWKKGTSGAEMSGESNLRTMGCPT